MRYYYIADWRRRDEAEKVKKLISLYLALQCVVAIGCIAGLILTQNTPQARILSNLPIQTSNHLPLNPDKPYKVVKAEITAYNPEVGQTDDTPFLTASQQPVKEGIAACPRRLSFGTWIEIQGQKYQCQDRMNIRYKNNFDIFLFSKSRAIAFGRKTLDVKIYE